MSGSLEEAGVSDSLGVSVVSVVSFPLLGVAGV